MATERRPINVTHEAVLKAMAEYDRMGQDAFLELYGFRRARTHMVWYRGKSYDSKAIVGAAFGYLAGNPPPLRSDEFHGGAPTIRALKAVGFDFDPPPASAQRNPPWSRDELILALALYRKHEGRDPGDSHPDVIAMSALLREMAGSAGLVTYRNPNGVAMKLMNFRSLDPAFTSGGGKGLASASKLDREVWNEFSADREALAVAAEAIREAVKSGLDEDAIDELDSYQAKEGRVSYRLHRHLERDQKLVALAKGAALKANGKLACEACLFDFLAAYGARGAGYIEAHHVNPVHAMEEGATTTIADLALLCANCHRMVHSAKPWLTVEDLRGLLRTASDV